ncbi:hypothetical protein [Pseudanabaena sp. UWO311]|nr:hypothetical protein [Pseudanabaena sp. UWO311]
MGRIKGDGEKGDRFYYLRDLPIETNHDTAETHIDEVHGRERGSLT